MTSGWCHQRRGDRTPRRVQTAAEPAAALALHVAYDAQEGAP